MRIGIDARLYGTKNGGIGRYIQMLITELEKIDTQNQYVILLQKNNFADYQPSVKNFVKILADFRPYSWREQVFLPGVLKSAHCDIWHFPHWNVPWFAPRPFVVTLHDLIPTLKPNPHSSTLPAPLYYLKFFIHRAILKRALYHAEKIISISNFTCLELLKNFSIFPAKITTVYEGVTSLAKNSFQPPAAVLMLENFSNYFLYVGNFYPHKNLEFLLKSFKIYKDKCLSSAKLVLAGRKDYFQDRFRDWANHNSLDSDVIFIENPSDPELFTLYSSALAFVFPSLNEGFGLPPLEAMDQGLPVLAARASCLPEILGPAALFFDPHSCEDLARAMRQISTDQTLRQKLIAYGRARASLYQWPKMAHSTLEVYQIAAHASKKIPT